jgi:hypothetical protein
MGAPLGRAWPPVGAGFHLMDLSEGAAAARAGTQCAGCATRALPRVLPRHEGTRGAASGAAALQEAAACADRAFMRDAMFARESGGREPRARSLPGPRSLWPAVGVIEGRRPRARGATEERGCAVITNTQPRHLQRLCCAQTVRTTQACASSRGAARRRQH